MYMYPNANEIQRVRTNTSTPRNVATVSIRNADFPLCLCVSFGCNEADLRVRRHLKTTNEERKRTRWIKTTANISDHRTGGGRGDAIRVEMVERTEPTHSDQNEFLAHQKY